MYTYIYIHILYTRIYIICIPTHDTGLCVCMCVCISVCRYVCYWKYFFFTRQALLFISARQCRSPVLRGDPEVLARDRLPHHRQTLVIGAAPSPARARDVLERPLALVAGGADTLAPICPNQVYYKRSLLWSLEEISKPYFKLLGAPESHATAPCA